MISCQIIKAMHGRRAPITYPVRLSQPHRTKMRYLTRIIGLACAFSAASICFAQGAGVPKPVDMADSADQVADVASRARSTMVLSPNRRFVVEGDTFFGAQLLTANEIVFKPKARLIFQDGTPNTAGHFYIVANRIVVEDPNNPGIITWQRTAPVAPPDRGQAASGGGGSGDGGRGGDGASGAPGSTGLTGATAPALTLFTRNAGQGGLVIDFAGGPGGPGGVGQIGGNGGGGARGSSARQARQSTPLGTVWLPSCEAGPGHGGTGGNGGIGGPGGVGGKGGNGGNVTLVSTPDRIPTLFQAVRVNLAAGDGGAGGAGGGGGQGGPGGPEGQLANFCNSAGRNGSPGAAGGPGQTGSKGEQGRAGQPFVSQLTESQFKDLFGFN